MGDEPDDEKVYVRGRGIVSSEQVLAAIEHVHALRKAVRGLVDTGSAEWALSELRKEVAALEVARKRGVGRPRIAARASDLRLILIAEAMRDFSAPKLAAKLHLETPGAYGATALAVEKRIKTIRALPHERREAMLRDAFNEHALTFIRESEASGVTTKAEADLFWEIWGVAAEPGKLTPATADLLREVLEAAGWGNKPA